MINDVHTGWGCYATLFGGNPSPHDYYNWNINKDKETSNKNRGFFTTLTATLAIHPEFKGWSLSMGYIMELGWMMRKRSTTMKNNTDFQISGECAVADGTRLISRVCRRVIPREDLLHMGPRLCAGDDCQVHGEQTLRQTRERPEEKDAGENDSINGVSVWWRNDRVQEADNDYTLLRPFSTKQMMYWHIASEYAKFSV